MSLLLAYSKHLKSFAPLLCCLFDYSLFWCNKKRYYRTWEFHLAVLIGFLSSTTSPSIISPCASAPRPIDEPSDLGSKPAPPLKSVKVWKPPPEREPAAATLPLRTSLWAMRRRSGPVKNTKPSVSVMKPGVSNSAPAAANSIPSTISVAGNSPELSRALARVSVARPCCFKTCTPMTAVATTKPRVESPPIRSLTSNSRSISTRGVAMKNRKRKRTESPR